MNIVFNGQGIQVPEACTLLQFFNNSDVCQGMVIDQSVVAVNLEFVHKDNYHSYELTEGDAIELLTAVVGG